MFLRARLADAASQIRLYPNRLGQLFRQLFKEAFVSVQVGSEGQLRRQKSGERELFEQTDRICNCFVNSEFLGAAVPWVDKATEPIEHRVCRLVRDCAVREARK